MRLTDLKRGVGSANGPGNGLVDREAEFGALPFQVCSGGCLLLLDQPARLEALQKSL
ncbi:MAG TPA: hypothetical protein VLV83_14850 [Acidobacteriota bacterium]|nr:hypothetical protein [Acidobacteriota bacterium]